MSRAPKLSIVIAVKDGRSNVPAVLNALKRAPGNTEIILSCAGPATDVAPDKGATILSLSEDTLIPSLWSAGIRSAGGDRVALTTAEFVPGPHWVERVQAADLDHWVGVGGAIENDPRASAVNWAIYFLRYSAFAPPLRPGETDEIAADDAVYDRAAILEHPDLLEEGFWEPSFHRRFRAAGKKLMLDPAMVIVHHGTVSARKFASQRFLHGRAYGIERAERGSMVRNLLFLIASPMVTPLLLARIVSRIAKRPAYRGKLWPAFPWLVRFTLAWAAGETGGYVSALGVRRKRAVTPSKGHA